MVTLACNSSYSGGSSRPAWANVCKTPAQPIKIWHGNAHLSSKICGKHKQRAPGLGWPRHKLSPSLKNNQCINAWGMAQVVEQLPSNKLTITTTKTIIIIKPAPKKNK
jgi:hypothetical protein